jgi:hypothetical protein
VKPYAFQIGHTKHLLPANSDSDAEIIAELLGARLLGEVKLSTDDPICKNCFAFLICPDCEDFEYEDH